MLLLISALRARVAQWFCVETRMLWWLVAGGNVGGEPQRDMPREVFDQLSAAGRRCCRNIVSDKPVVTPWAPDWVGSQGGGSIDNQLHNGELVDDPWNKGELVFSHSSTTSA